jgi:hypothetical protein
VALTPEQEQAYRDELKKMGKERVRASLDHGTISPVLVSIAWDWISAEEADEKRRQEISNSEQIELMRRASAAMELQAAEAARANRKATIALIIAIASPIISAIVAAIGIWMSHWDVLHK